MAAIAAPDIELVVDLVNGWATAARHNAHGVRTEDRPDLEAIIANHGQYAAAPLDEDEVAHLANDCYAIFAAEPPDRFKLANRLLKNVHPVVGEKAIKWDDGKLHTTISGLALAALAGYALNDPQLLRLGVCNGYRCQDAFVDSSQAATRKYCSTRCQNRTKLRRYRAQNTADNN